MIETSRLTMGCFAVALTAVFADSSSATPPQMEECRILQEFARVTMTWRQAGMSFADTYETFKIASAQNAPPPYSASMAPEIIKQAYFRPVEPTDRLAEVSSIKFGEEIWAVCMNSGR